MANNDNLNLGQNEESADTAKKTGGKGKLIVIIVLLLAVAGGGAAFFLTSGSGEDAGAGTTEEVAAEEEPKVPLYLEMAKLLVNLEYEGRTHYVQAEMQLMSYDEDVIEQSTRDMPAIRDRLINLFSAQDFGALKTIEGKEALRAQAIATVNKVLGLTRPDAIEAVYFENFVLQ